MLWIILYSLLDSATYHNSLYDPRLLNVYHLHATAELIIVHANQAKYGV